MRFHSSPCESGQLTDSVWIHLHKRKWSVKTVTTAKVLLHWRYLSLARLLTAPHWTRRNDKLQGGSCSVTPGPQYVTKLLVDWRNGDQSALDQLMPLVYAELHRMATRYMNQQNRDHTLQTTALIHETFVRLVGDSGKKLENRAQFLASPQRRCDMF